MTTEIQMQKQPAVEPITPVSGPAAAISADLADKKSIRQAIFQLAGPTLTEMVLINFVQMMNMVMVGRAGAKAVAAVGLTSQPYLMLMVLFVTLNTGTTVIVARSIGAGKSKD